MRSTPRPSAIPIRPSPSIPIPISQLPLVIWPRSQLPTDPVLSSSVPTQPSRLQARLQALKTMRASAGDLSSPPYRLIPIDHSYTLPDTLELASLSTGVGWTGLKPSCPLSPEMPAPTSCPSTSRRTSNSSARSSPYARSASR